MQIRGAVVHQLIKDSGRPSASLMLSQQGLPIDGRLTTLVEQVRQAYNKIGRGYGVFSDSSQMSGHIRPLCTSATDLFGVSKRLMEQLKDLVSGVTLATGGYYLFVLYEDGGRRYFLVVSLKNRSGLVFDRSFRLKENRYLDLEDLHEAARVDMSGWSNGENNYLSFAKRRGDRQMTHYFVEFIGCREYQDARELSNTLATAVKRFCEDKELDDNRTRQIEQTAFQYFEALSLQAAPVHLEEAARAIWPEDPDDFVDFVHEHHPVTDGFMPHLSTLKKRLIRVSFSLSNGRLRFSCDRDLIDEQIIYDEQSQTLTIREVPPDVFD